MINLHFKLFFTLFLLMPLEKELHNIFGVHGYRFDFLSKKEYEGKFNQENLSEGQFSPGCIR